MSPVTASRVVYGHDRIVCDFVASAFPHVQSFEGCIGLGIDKDGAIAAGVVIELKSPFDAHVSVFSVRPDAWTRQTVEEVFSYLFDHLGVARVTCLTSKKNKRSRKTIEGLGFRHEGTLKKGLDGNRDAIVYGMVREDCRWIKR